MNKNRYRIVFNKARGSLMAVAENACSQSKHNAQTDLDSTSISSWWPMAQLKPLAFGLLLALGAQLIVIPAADAQIVAYRNAPVSQQPTVLSAGNGVPLVNIQTPSAAGVSRNTYSQFDVLQRGAILNNSRNNIQTQLGGWVQGNPWLAGGSASIILNEVISANPSQLRGYVEIAGSKAQLVIANPAGVTCDGCGFINATRTTLTTGSPVINGGNLEGYRVEGGTISIQGSSMDASRSDYTDLISRAVEVNAGLWANNLKVTTGSNLVNAANTQATSTAGSGAAPSFALDVSLLGGMYAGKITLVGTEAGVGVRNAGQIGASVGEVTITADGLLQNSGTISSKTQLNVDAGNGIDNSGTIYAMGDAVLNTANLSNTVGLIGAKGQLSISGAELSNTLGGNLSSEQNILIAGSSLDNRGGQILALGSATMHVSGVVDNTASLISAGQTLNIEANRLVNSNTKGANLGVEGQSLAISANQIDNSAGAMRANQALSITSGGTLNNNGGLLSSADTLKILDPNASSSGNSDSKTLVITNTAGTMIADKWLAIDSNSLTGDGSLSGLLDMSVKLISDYTHSGKFAANRDASLETKGMVSNGASILAGNSLALSAASIDNAADGKIAASTLRLNATATHTLTNRGLIDGSDTFIDAVTFNNLGTGRVYGDHIAIAVTTLNNEAEGGKSPVIAARNRLDIGANTINNRENALLFSVGDMSIGGALDGNHLATGQADTFNNISAAVETLGNLSANVVNMNNKRRTFSVSRNFDSRGTAYSQRCEDSDCDYISHITDTITRYKDVVTSNSPASTIRVSGNASLKASNLSNEYSSIEAGGNLDLLGNTLTNRGAELFLQTDVSRSSHLIHWGNRDHGITYSASSSSALIGTVPAVISAGGNLTGDFTARIDNLTIRQKTAPIVAKTGTTVLDLDTGNVSQGASITPSPSTKLPSNSLYHRNTSPTSRFLIETDARFANFRQWLNSDYMLQQLSINPAITQKRLGDGFYEQRLINEQIAQLTGRRFLNGYQDDETQYTALMNAGVTVAKAWNLVPGVALSAAQVAALTTDIVWLVEKTVTLDDGSSEKVLVPQVYARLKDGDLSPSGALLSGDNVQFKLGGDLTNSGSIAGRQVVALNAENVKNLGGRISGQKTFVAARNDLSSIGGVIAAEDRLEVSAGHDLTVASSTVDLSFSEQGTANTAHQQVIDRVAGLYVTNPGGTLIASAGNDLKLMAAVITNAAPASDTPSAVLADAPVDALAGKTTLSAGHNIDLGTVAESSHSFTSSKKTKRTEDSSTEVGSMIQSTGDIVMQAGNDLTARAASVTSVDGALDVSAANNLRIESGESSYATEYNRKSKKSGLLSSSTKVRRDTVNSTTAQASTFSGKTTALRAGQDTAIKGSNVVASGDLTIKAGRDLSIESAIETHNETHYKSEKKSGFSASLMGGVSYGDSAVKQNMAGQVVSRVASSISGANVGLSSGRDTTVSASNVVADTDLTILASRDINILAASETQNTQNQFKSNSSSFGVMPGASARFTAYGKMSASENGTASATTQSTSLLSANNGDLTVRAGLADKYQGTGSGNLTTQGANLLAQNKITLTGNAIDLQAIADTSSSHTETKSKSFTAGAALAGSLGTQITAISDKIEQARNTDNSRLQGALVLKAGYDAYKLTQGKDATSIDAAGTTEAATQAAQVAKTAQIAEARNIAGSAGAASASSGIGISVSIGSSKSQSESSTQETQVIGTNLQAREIVISASETDLRMAAAKLQAETIALSAKRDVILEAAANTSELASSNKGSSVGGGVTFGFGGQQNGLSFQLNASRSQGKANGKEAIWDNTQITATDKLSVTSGGDTTLKGAQLAGRSVAFDVGGDLLVQTLQDSSRYGSKQSSSGFSISVCWFLCAGVPVTGSLSASEQSIKHSYLSAIGQSGIAAGGGGFDIKVKGGTELVGAAITSSAPASDNRLTTASLTSSDLQNAQRTQSKSSSISVAYSGASALTTLAGNAAQNIMGNLQGNAALPKNGSQSGTTQSVISPATVNITGSGNAAKDASSRQTAEQLTARDAASANGSLTNTLTLQQAQALPDQLRRQQENMEAAKLVGAVLSNVVGDLAVKQKWKEGGPEKLALHGMVGLIEAKIGGGSAAAGALGAMSQEAMAPILAEYLRQNDFVAGSDEYKALMQLGATLVGTAVGVLATGDVKGASTGANAAFVGVTNNYLKHDEAIRMAALQEKKAMGQCQTECQQEIDTLKQKDDLRNAVLDACRGVSNETCDTARQDVRNAAAEYLRKETIALNRGAGYSLADVYASENRETRQYANGTLDGKASGVVVGAAGTAWDAAKAAFSLAGNLLGSAFGNESSQQALKAGASTAWDYVRNPDNWPYLLGAMTPEQREQLAQAYEKGDGNAVGRFMGEQVVNLLSNLPSGGAAAGTIKIVKAVDKVEGAASALTKAEKISANSAAKAGNEAYHYTAQQWGEAIKKDGLWEGSYATPNSDLSGLGAKLELSLVPTKASPEIKISIDLDAMRKAGYEIPEPTRVSNVVTDPKTGRVYNMPGGGWEMKFPYEIPAKYIKEVVPVK